MKHALLCAAALANPFQHCLDEHPTPEQAKMMQGAADQVALTVQGLQSRGVYDNLDALRKTNEQLYLDVIGDSAHALHGLKLAMGEDGVRY